MNADFEDRTSEAFERLLERSQAELRAAAELNDALRAERDRLATQLDRITSHPLYRVARRASRLAGRGRA